MGLKYDKQKLENLYKEEQKLESSVVELNAILEEKLSKSTWHTTGDYQLFAARHGVTCRNLELVQTSISSQERLKLKEEDERSKKRAPAFNRWLWNGSQGLSQEEKELHLIEASSELTGQQPRIDGLGFKVPLSSQGTYRMDTRSDIDAGTKKAVADMWSSRVIEGMSFYGNLEKVCTTFKTDSGGNFTFPVMDESPIGAAGILFDQAAEVGGLDIPKRDLASVGSVTFKSFLRNSGSIRLRRESISDVSFNLFNRADRHAMRRMSNSWNTAFLNGSNVEADGEPFGLTIAATPGIAGGYTANALTNANPGLSLDQVLQFLSSSPDAYMDNYEGINGFQMETGQSCSILSIDLEKSIRQARTSSPGWFGQSGGFGEFKLSKNGMAGMLADYDYYKNAILGKTTEMKTTALVGHFGYYGIRTIGNMELFRFFDSRTAQANAVEIIGYTRRDARPIGALSGPGLFTTKAINRLNITALNA